MWTPVLADHAGNGLAELTTASDPKVSFARNSAPEATLAISHRDEATASLVAALANGIPRLRLYRDGVLRFNGHLAGMDEQGDENGASVALTFRGPFGLLAHRHTAASRVFTAADAGDIAWSLISEAGGGTGIGLGSIAATKTRDRTYEDKQVAEAIVELTEVLDGFDFEVIPVDAGATMGTFNVYTRQGEDRPSARFEYGKGTLANVRAVRRTTVPPVNRVRVLGQEALRAEASDAASIARYGLYMRVESATDVTEQATLNDRAIELLRPNLGRVIDFTPEPGLSPKPWDDFWLGDTVRFGAREGSFSEALSLRVNAIEIEIADGIEAGYNLTVEQV